MHSGGAQQFGQRSQPAQSYFTGLGCTLYVRQSHSFAAVGAARRGHSRGFQRSSLCLTILTRALCASLVPRSASKERKRAGNLFRKWLRAEASSQVCM